MARDGLVPPAFFGAIHEIPDARGNPRPDRRFRRDPGRFLPLRYVAELVNIGTLLAFLIVCAAVLIMRRTHPNANRPFKVPFMPITPILGIVTCLVLMFSLPGENWVRGRLARIGF